MVQFIDTVLKTAHYVRSYIVETVVGAMCCEPTLHATTKGLRLYEAYRKEVKNGGITPKL